MAPRFDGCEQVEQIGRGGFGTVYRAYQTTFRRQVAIKVLSVDTRDDRTIRRFRREVGAVGSLSGHPNIVVVHDIGTTDEGDPFLMMAFLGGGTLGDRISATDPLPWRRVIGWTIKLAGALEAAHAAKVLHLDVKPDNVLFDEFGEPQLVDFGIARLEGVTHSRSAHVKATPVYAGPEVLSGASPTEAADVYSLAATAYAALRGRPAFVEATDETMAPMITRVLTQPPSPLGDEVLPQPVWEVLERGLAKDPAARFASAAEFGRALQDAQRAVGVSVTTMTVPGGRTDQDEDTTTIDPVPPVLTPHDTDPGEDEPDPGADPEDPPRRRLVTVLIGIAVLVVAVVGGVLLARATNDEGDGDDAVSDIDPDTIEPAALRSPGAAIEGARPTGLEADFDGQSTTVELDWVNHSPTADGVAIQQGQDVLIVLDSGEDSFSVERVDRDARTCFIVGAVGQPEADGSRGISWASGYTCAVSGVPAAPELTAERGAQGQYVELAWPATIDNARKYIVRRSGVDEPVTEEPAAQLEVIDGQVRLNINGIAEDTEACFTVVAENEAGESDPSNEDCVDPR